jgi:hypothetical protein
MICRRLAPEKAPKTQPVTALTAAGAMPRPRAATAVQQPISAVKSAFGVPPT